MSQMNSLQYKKLDFEEFCAAALSVHQMEGMENWEQHALTAYEHFEKDGNRAITVEELVSVCFICFCQLVFRCRPFKPTYASVIFFSGTWAKFNTTYECSRARLGKTVRWQAQFSRVY